MAAETPSASNPAAGNLSDDLRMLRQMLRQVNLAQVFDEATMKRGRTVADQGNVGSVGLQRQRRDMRLRAPVLGTEGIYRTEVWLRPVQDSVDVESSCTCPVAVRCKHAVAVLLEVFSDLFQKSAEETPWNAWEDWLVQVEPGAADDAPDTSVEVGRVLGLLLQLGRGELPGLLVRLVWMRPSKKGDRLVDPKPLRIGPDGPLPKPPGGWDNALVEKLAALSLGHTDYMAGTQPWIRIASAYQERALETLLDEVPCFLEKPGAERLQHGPLRHLDYGWKDLPDGSQRLDARAEGLPEAELLVADSVWYLDRAAHTLGRISDDPQLLKLLHAAPVVAPEHVEDIGRRLQQVPRLKHLPKPSQRGRIEPLEVEPQPLLRLRQLRLRRWVRGRTADETPACARLYFLYDGHRMEALGADRERRLSGSRVLEIHRQRGAEQAAFDRLEGLGLIAAASLGLYDPQGHDASLTQADYVLEAQRDALASPEQWQPLLPRLVEQGFQIEFAPDYPAQVLEPSGDWFVDIEDGDDAGNPWFDLSLGIEVAGERVDLLPILRRLLSDPDFPLTPGARESESATWLAPLDEHRSVRLPLKRLRALIQPLLDWLVQRGGEQDPALRIRRSQLNSLSAIADGEELVWHGAARLRETLAELAANRVDIEPPTGFNAELRPYQRDGLNWLGFLSQARLGGILADDMGLGKTVQVLAHLLVEKQAGRLPTPALVVAPTSLVVNWRNEARRFVPDLRVLVLHGGGRDAHFDEIDGVDLVITTYPLLPRDRDVLLQHPFSLLILDEAQTIKNARTQAAQVVREINATRRLAMTGTPLENHLGELWAQLDAVEPGVLGDERQFTRLYRTPIEKHGDSERQARLNRRIAPLMLRRRKEDVLTDLPPKTEIVREVELAGDQRALYETLRLAQHERVREAITARGLAQSGIVVLDALLKLRQVCCDPRLVKLEAARRVEDSAKLELLLELLDSLVAEGRRVLVFSQFAEMLGLIDSALTERGIDHLLLTGATRERAPLVDRFQAGEVPVFLISLKAGGVGLNLTAADTVIHYDPWWNPAVEAQASDRAHRIGQDKHVFVYKLICAGTVEEKIQAMQSRKAELARAVLEGGTSTAVRFGQDDLDELFAPL